MGFTANGGVLAHRRRGYPVAVDPIAQAAQWAGASIDEDQLGLWEGYALWLEREATAAGGIGPNEIGRIRSRHIADSLLFAALWTSEGPPLTLLDLGSGVGLPGIPLAILWPYTRVRLLDRSGRRCDLARRAVRTLGLSIEVVEAEASTFPGPGADMVVARATAPPERVLQWARRLLLPGGVVVIGGSHTRPPQPVAGETIVAVPAKVLDRPVWLRMMAAT